jgi:hypothetical protein
MDEQELLLARLAQRGLIPQASASDPCDDWRNRVVDLSKTPLKVTHVRDLDTALRVSRGKEKPVARRKREESALEDTLTLGGRRGEAMSTDASPKILAKKRSGRKTSLPLAEPPSFALQVDVTDGERKVLYSLMPSRVVGDRRLNYTDLRVLLALTCYTSALGIAYPNRSTLARRIGIHPTAVSRSMTRLQQFGYVRRLQSIGKKYPGAHSRGARWFVLIREGAPVPPAERVWQGRK